MRIFGTSWCIARNTNYAVASATDPKGRGLVVPSGSGVIFTAEGWWMDAALGRPSDPGSYQGSQMGVELLGSVIAGPPSPPSEFTLVATMGYVPQRGLSDDSDVWSPQNEPAQGQARSD